MNKSTTPKSDAEKFVWIPGDVVIVKNKTAPKGGAPGSHADSLRRIRTHTARKQK